MTDSPRTIVIGVDYSDQSIFAVDEALRIASTAPGTRLVPALILPPNSVGGSGEDAAEATRSLVERSIENLEQLIGTRARALGTLPASVEPHVRFGVPADELTLLAREFGAQLITVGTHARRGLSHLLLGSVAEEVLKKAECSVLIARASAPGGDGTAASHSTSKGHSAKEAPGTTRGVREGSAGTARDGSAVRDGGAIEGAGEGVEPTVVAGPHIDAGRVVLHVLDAPSGQVFLCAFENEASVSVEPLEGNWVPAPSSAARARVARIALQCASSEPALFSDLFEEIERRRAPPRSSE
jgi:nucleotide-binding universal stress UspA family protein